MFDKWAEQEIRNGNGWGVVGLSPPAGEYYRLFGPVIGFAVVVEREEIRIAA